MAQIYILPFLSDNQLIVKKVAAAAAGAINSLELIQVAIAGGLVIKDAVAQTLSNEVGITLDASDKDIINSCNTVAGVGAAAGSLYAIIKINKNPNNSGSVFNIGANKNHIDSYGLIFNAGDEILLPNIIACRNAATPVPAPPAPTPSPKIFRLLRFVPPFFFPPPFIGPPLLSPFAPYGNSVIRTPVGSPFIRLPGLSLPPDFVPAVIPTVRQPMLSPFGNPFPTREPSPVYRNLFGEKSRPAHMRSPRFKMDGGYYAKYLKYKNKYLELKNQLENQV